MNPLRLDTHDIRLGPRGKLFQSAELQGDLNERLETLGGLLRVLLGVLAVLFDVQPDGSTLTSSSTQSEDDPAAILEFDVETLVLGDGVVDGVGVAKVTGLLDLEGGLASGSAQLGSDKGRFGKGFSKSVHDLVSTGLDLLVIVPEDVRFGLLSNFALSINKPDET
jgi:hypothetical protein